MGTEFQTLNGERMSIGEEAINDLETAMRGRLLRKDHPDYDNARRIWNGMIDKQPALIAECTGTADIITSVQFAAEHGLLTSVRGGGHNIAGSAVCDDGLMIDLSGLRAVRVDPEGRRAFVQPGALLGDVDHETQAFGLAVPTGINSTTGIAGLAVGGGYGWLSRKYGHTVDNIVSVRIVTADGGLKKASVDENADLFWAIRGGSGNFGIVTEFEFELHPVETSMMTGPVVHSLEDAASALKMYRDIAARLPDEATYWFVLRKAPPLPFLAPEHHGKTVLLMPMAFAGLLNESEEALAPLRSIGNPIADGVSPHPYTGWQSAFDPLLTEGARNYWKSHDFTELTDDVIDLMVEAASDLPTDECEIFVAQLGGAAGRVDEDAMAYAHRKTRYAMNIHARWTDENQDAVCKAWARALFDKATPLAEGSVYINFVPEAGEERSKGAFGANQARLESIKAKVDPANLFRSNVMIQPDP